MPPHTVHFEHIDSIPLAVIKGRAEKADLGKIVPEWCGLVWRAVRAQQAKGGRHVALYWDGAIRLEVGVELLSPFEDTGEVMKSATPSGTVAWTTHLGPYGGLGAANAAIKDWCKAKGHRLAGPSWEIYGHWQPEWNADPSRIRTDVFWLVSESTR